MPAQLMRYTNYTQGFMLSLVEHLGRR